LGLTYGGLTYCCCHGTQILSVHNTKGDSRIYSSAP
jgi:hypothetical protein